ncbi:MAG: hypothetical protein M3Z03_13210 [Actinomycetota bacterium]|nr:hypothetical protein [Actinomycetota bacterium]
MAKVDLHEQEGLGPVPAENQPGHHPPVEQDKPSLTRLKAAHREKRVFHFAFEPLLIPFAAAVGVRDSSAWVELAPGDDVDGKDDLVTIHFGPWSMAFPRIDVVSADVTGPYRLHRVAGPPHLSLKDRGVTFATTRQQGLCMQLREPRKALDPLGVLRHPAATVTVADPEELQRALSEPVR